MKKMIYALLSAAVLVLTPIVASAAELVSIEEVDAWVNSIPENQISSADWTALDDVVPPTPTPVPVNVDFDMSKVQYPTHWMGAMSDSGAVANETFIASTDKASHSGERSLYFKIGKQQGTYSIVTDLLETTDAGKTYRLEFWAKGADGTDKQFGASIADGTSNNTGHFAWNAIWDLYSTSELGEDNWRKYTYDFTGKAISAIGLQLWDPYVLLFDDFKLYELSNGEIARELTIVNGDMEDYLDFNEVPEHSVYNESWVASLNGFHGLYNDYMRFEDIGGGNYAMHIRYNRPIAANIYVRIANLHSNGQIASGTAYTVEYDIKQGSRGEVGSVVFFPLRMWNYSQCFRTEAAAKANDTTKSVTALDNGFKHVVKEFTSSTSGDAVFGIIAQTYCDMVIDNIKIYASSDSSKTNLIKDGDFSDNHQTYDVPDFRVKSWKISNEADAVLSLDFDIAEGKTFDTEIYAASYSDLNWIVDVQKNEKILSTADDSVAFDLKTDGAKETKVFFWDNQNEMIPRLTPLDPNNRIKADDIGDDVVLHLPLVQRYLEGPYENIADYTKGTGFNAKPVRLGWSYDKSEGCTFEAAISENADMTDAKVITTDDDFCMVYNLKSGQTYYWQVSATYDDGQVFTSDVASFTTQDMAPRQIYAHGVMNMRDLGGWHTDAGSRVKQGLLYRSLCFDDTNGIDITDEGIDTLVNELGIKTEIDLRNEIVKNSSVLGDEIKYVYCPMNGSGNFITDSANTESIRRVFETMGDAENYPIVYHCQAGADRTGVISYLLNGLLGVSKEDLFRDYQFTSFVISRNVSGILNTYVKTLDEYEGADLQEKIYNYLNNEIGVSVEDLDFIIDYMTE